MRRGVRRGSNFWLGVGAAAFCLRMLRRLTRSRPEVVREEGVSLFPVAIRYVWPSELDLMACLAGLELEARTDGWEGRRYDGKSEAVVSVYRKPA